MIRHFGDYCSTLTAEVKYRSVKETVDFSSKPGNFEDFDTAHGALV
jgi:hypothetical protein